MNRKKVLIIDDDPRNIFALSATLSAKGFPNLSASGAREGIGLLETDKAIGIVLLDMMMPDMDGYQALQVLKSQPATANVPVIAVTAQAMQGDRDKCLDAGAIDYIAKPINVDLLLAKLNHFITT